MALEIQYNDPYGQAHDKAYVRVSSLAINYITGTVKAEISIYADAVARVLERKALHTQTKIYNGKQFEELFGRDVIRDDESELKANLYSLIKPSFTEPKDIIDYRYYTPAGEIAKAQAEIEAAHAAIQGYEDAIRAQKIALAEYEKAQHEAGKEPTEKKLEGFYGKIALLEEKLKETYHTVEMKEAAYIDLIEGRPVVDEAKLEKEKEEAKKRQEFLAEMAS